MSKIFEALENAEKQRLTKGASPFLQPREEKKAPPAVDPKSEKLGGLTASPVPEPREVKGTGPVAGSALPPVPASKEEKKTTPVPEPGEVKRTGPVAGPAFTPAPAPKEEKKTPPPLQPKSGWMEKSGLFHSPKSEEVKAAKEEPRIVPAPTPREEKKVPEPVEVKKTAFTPAPAPKEEKKIPPVVAPKLTSPAGPREEKTPSVMGPKFTPPAVAKEEKKIPPPKEVRAEKQQAAVKPARQDKTGSDRPLVSIFQPGSLGAEQFRKLRTHVLKLNASNPPKTIMVTSAAAGEGKTFVSANLAAGIAHDLHFHALLVDCDLRSPSLSHWFGVQNGHGLSDYLVGKGQLSELILKTEMEKLSILTGGSAQEKPVELMGSKKMEALIRELKSRYDDRYIILDSTPLLATSEPEVLARLVDGIIIVVRAGVTPRETVKQAVASLDPEKILGFVLNDVHFKSSGLSSRYFGSDGYYAKYGYGIRGAEPRSASGAVSPLRKKSGS